MTENKKSDNKLALTPMLQVLPSTKLKRVRELPLVGQVLVEPEEEVDARTIVAEAELPGELLVLRVPERMGVNVIEAVAGLKVKEGDLIEEGQVVCEHVGLFGLFRSQLESPVAGSVDFFSKSTGHLGIRLASTTLRLEAYLPGRVTGVVAGRSVTIESECAFVQGVFGVGGARYGNLHVLEDSFDREVTVDDIPADCTETIFVGGSHVALEALRKASENGAGGFITGSINDATLRAYLGQDLGIALTGDEDISMSLIVTEGFGVLPMAERTRAVFVAGNGMVVTMNGATQVRAGAIRPEVILPKQVASGEQVVSGSLELGSQVRVIRQPYFGELGKIVGLPSDPQFLESGAKARIAEVELVSGKVVVPRANLELI